MAASVVVPRRVMNSVSTAVSNGSISMVPRAGRARAKIAGSYGAPRPEFVGFLGTHLSREPLFTESSKERSLQGFAYEEVNVLSFRREGILRNASAGVHSVLWRRTHTRVVVGVAK